MWAFSGFWSYVSLQLILAHCTPAMDCSTQHVSILLETVRMFLFLKRCPAWKYGIVVIRHGWGNSATEFLLQKCSTLSEKSFLLQKSKPPCRWATASNSLYNTGVKHNSSTSTLPWQEGREAICWAPDPVTWSRRKDFGAWSSRVDYGHAHHLYNWWKTQLPEAWEVKGAVIPEKSKFSADFISKIHLWFYVKSWEENYHKSSERATRKSSAVWELVIQQKWSLQICE